MGGLGVANATDVLLSAVAALTGRRRAQRSLLEGTAGSLAAALGDPEVVLTAMQSLWSHLTADPSDVPPFTLTLSASAPLVLRSRRRSFSSAASVSIGGTVCNRTAVSEDGRWLAFITPIPSALCETTSASDCHYATIVVTNPASNTTRGAALACPPFCSGTATQGTGVFPLATASGTVAASASGAASFVPAELQPSGLAQALTQAAYASTTGSSARSGGAGSAVAARVYPAGLYFAAACSAAGFYTDPSTGACTNASDPRFPLCAFGGGDDCEPCQSQAMCPGGFRCWPLPGFYVAAESSHSVLPCAAPDAEARCVGWSTAFAQTMCGWGYLQVRAHFRAYARGLSRP